MTNSHTPAPWRNFASVYSRLSAPLTPDAADAARIAAAIEGKDDNVLLLGVTPGLAMLGKDLTAIEGSPAMISRVWPGDSSDRRAIVGDWTAMPFEPGRFGAIIGDGALNSVAAGLDELVGEIARLLPPGGISAQRTFTSPDERENLEAIRSEALAGRIGNVHALKWRIAGALAREPSFLVPVSDILATFNRLFPDREELAAGSGWPMEQIATLDAYVGAWHSLSFPTRSALRDLGERRFGDCRFVESEGYPLAERCPLIVWTR